MKRTCKVLKKVTSYQQHLNDLDIVEVQIDKNVEIISDGTFLNCKNLKKIVFEEPSSVKELCCAAFRNTGIDTLFIPKSIIKIDRESFKNCEQLTSVVFEQGSAIKYIKKRAFTGCKQLTNVKLPKTKIEIYGQMIDFKEDVPTNEIVLFLQTGNISSKLKPFTELGKREKKKKDSAKKNKEDKKKFKGAGRISRSSVPSSSHSKNKHRSWYR